MRNQLDPQLAAEGISPSFLIRSYSDKEWEVFIQEWTSGFEPKYHFVEINGGAGDKGRDVIAFLGPQNEPSTEWDNYQCKHYVAPVAPSDMWTDFGKLCYYTWKGDYSVPRRYRIVAPLEVTPSFKELMKHPNQIREQLKANWAKHCATKITAKHDIPLEGELADYFEAFDFGRIGYDDLAADTSGDQVIVFENIPPPAHLRDQITYAHFTDNADNGRQGFFP